MNIAFLGTSTEDKRFFILSMAKILTNYNRTVIFSAKPYHYSGTTEPIYDYCGVEIHQFTKESDLQSELGPEDYNLLDLEDYLPLPEGFQVVALSEPSRHLLEQCVRLAGAFSWVHPSLEIKVIYLNLMEYCKVNKKYLDLFWERSVPTFTKLSGAYPLYFEEANRVAMLETQFSDRLLLKTLTPSYKAVLFEQIQSLFNLEPKLVKSLIKKAERMK